MDDLDRAQEYESLALKAALSERKPVLKAAGHCYYCDEKVVPGALFCSAACGQDYEREEKIRRIIGQTKGSA